MPYSYDPILVLVSVLVAVAGAYACFDLVIRVQRTTGPKRRFWLALAALAIGGSIWAMHFIAMLAVKLPSVMQYDILITLVSGLVSILMTAVALAIVASNDDIKKCIFVGGTVMGAGITAMHYVGMSGMRGNFSLSYETTWLIVSVLVGVFASILSLWLAMGLQLRGVVRRLISAVVMGLSIAGVHYSGMYGTKFEPVAQAIELTQPLLSPFSIGLITALVTFGILAWSVLMLLPNSSPDAHAKSVTNATAHDTRSGLDTNGANSTMLQPESNNYNEIGSPETQEKSNPSSTLLDNTIQSTRLSQSHVSAEKAANELQTNTVEEVSSNTLDTTSMTQTKASTPPIDRIPIQRNKKTYFLEANDVASISADGHYTTVRTKDGQSHFCNTSFNKLLNDHHLPDFFRVHRSHAININCVVSFERKRDSAVVSLGTDEHEVPVSRSHITALQSVLGLTG